MLEKHPISKKNLQNKNTKSIKILAQQLFDFCNYLFVYYKKTKDSTA